MSTSTQLDKDEKGKCVDIKSYRGTIGSPVDPILCLVYVFVLGFNLVLENLIYMQLKEYLNICTRLLIQERSIIETLSLNWQDILMQILLENYLIVKVSVELVNFLAVHQFLGLVKSKIRLPQLLPKRNILRLAVVVVKFFG